MTEPILLRVSEAARLLAVSRSKAYELAAAGAIPTLRVGRGLRVPRAALERWVEQHTEEATGPLQLDP